MAKRGNAVQLHSMYSADFETCDAWKQEGNIIPDQRVWLAGFKNLKTMKSQYFTSIDDFMGAILARGDNVNTEYAFHNLKFDGSFIVPWLLNNGYQISHNKPQAKEFSVLIDKRNYWYSINIGVTKRRSVLLWDSLKLFPTPLEYLPNEYGTPTHKIEEDQEFYNKFRPAGYEPDQQEITYFEADLTVLAETLNKHIEFYDIRFKKTQASQSFYNFEQHFKAWKLRFPPLTVEQDETIRPAYWGGLSHVNPVHTGKIIKGVAVYDINSSYPYQLAHKKMPYGKALFEYGEGKHPDMSKFWVANALVRFKLKPGKVPCLPSKAIIEGKPLVVNKWVNNSEGIVSIIFCNIDYYTLNDSYDFEVIHWIWSVHFAWKIQPEIASFINKNNDDKVNYKDRAKAEHDPDLKQEYLTRSQRAKIDNNSFYGKFGEEITKEGKTPYLEDGEVIYKCDRVDVMTEYKRRFLPVAIATTAWGRQQLVTVANKLGNSFLYCDTDSIHYIENTGCSILDKLSDQGDFKIHRTDLGSWDFEGRYEQGKYLRSKCYMEGDNTNIEVTLAGLPADPHTGARSKKRSCITWDNFRIGLVIPGGNGRLRTVRTRTGNKLVPTDFVIRENDFYIGL